ncbi:uncharacterized protein LOC126735196 [Anthonomus grandis grandis]|uniref:uncharacterized protein LOC126735196 n=1 Tax=Anthonomus grandis grandis TaxID=2921223 RepID=UPI002165BA7F|nr:uncharacterized protein LOC126735196 [Anthonomus grandis grandis]
MNKEDIAYADDRDRLIIRNSIKYLHNLTFMDPLNVPTLKSLYRTNCRLMELRRHMFLPEKKSYERCERCFMNFSEGDTTNIEIQPVKLTAFAKKLINKVKTKGTNSLTPYQKIYYKKLFREHITEVKRQNKLVITCSFCKKPSEVLLDKPKLPKVAQTPQEQPKKKKKKKKKKDKLCGLNESVVFVSSTKAPRPKKPTNENSDTVPSMSPSKLNQTVSMSNIRALQPAGSLKRKGKKQKQNLKVSKKKPALAPKQLQPSTSISKAKDRLKQKSLNTLSELLKNGGAEKKQSKLKQFLDSL